MRKLLWFLLLSAIFAGFDATPASAEMYDDGAGHCVVVDPDGTTHVYPGSCVPPDPNPPP